jgi:P27 family predicted phage terminase small subunit
MKPGPPRKPTALKLLEGTARAPKPGLREPSPPPARLVPPRYLSPVARAEWRRLAGELFAQGVTTELDRGCLYVYVSVWGQLRAAEQMLAEAVKRDPAGGGLLLTTEAGNVIQHPAVGIANRARMLLLRAAAELGLTPAARARVLVAEPARPPRGAGQDKDNPESYIR